MPDFAALAARVAVPGRVSLEASPLGGPVVRLVTGKAQALVALQGAQVLNWTVAGEGLLWLSPVARLRPGKGIRGGVPVCWPWFADHPTDAGKPAHGFVRQRLWQVVRSQATADAATITLATATGDAGQAFWPHHAQAEMTVTLGAGLALSLATRNAGSTPFHLTQALHTYFRVSDIANAHVAGLAGVDYLDKLDGFARKRQHGEIAIAGEIDRIYVGDTRRIRLTDSGTGRCVEITSAGSRSAVVWNPWTDKTARLGDMGAPEAFRQMLCIETANAGDDVVTLAPQAEHRLDAAYRLSG